MNPHLTYILAQQRIADLQRAAEQARLAADARTRRRGSRDSNPISRLRARLARLTARLAPTGLREAKRFLSPKCELTPRELAYLTDTGDDDRLLAGHQSYSEVATARICTGGSRHEPEESREPSGNPVD
jgi:hypothetical protein